MTDFRNKFLICFNNLKNFCFPFNDKLCFGCFFAADFEDRHREQEFTESQHEKDKKFFIFDVSFNFLHDAGMFPCAVCQRIVGVNSIECKLWVHKKCNDLAGRLVGESGYVCHRYLGVAHPIDNRTGTLIDANDTPLNVKTAFCYLGDTENASGGCECTITAYCNVAWKRFRCCQVLHQSKFLSGLGTRDFQFVVVPQSCLAERHKP